MKYRKIFLGIWVVSTFIVAGGEAYPQCDCLGAKLENDHRSSGYPAAYEELRKSEVVFVGEVVATKKLEIPSADKGDSTYEYEVKFKVKRAWKKNLGEIIALRQGIESCLLGFKIGEEYLVYTVVHKNVLRTWYCSRTRLLAKAAADLKEFEESGENPLEALPPNH